MIRFRVAVVLMAALLTASVQAQAPQYRGRLSLMPLDIAMQNVIAGSGMATANVKGSTLSINGTFTGLKTPATTARLFRSPKPGMRGTPIGELTVTGETSGTISGSIELTKDQISDLAAGRFYVQLHSQKAPEGNLWGWLFAVEGKK
jgi:CHRD domain